jgi:hypothetical protein
MEKTQEKNQEERKQRERQEEKQERKQNELWVADWAFSVKENYAQKEGYDHITITGIFTIDKVYPGCPYCQAKSIFKCSCGKINCWDTQTNTVTCVWCGQTAELKGHIEALNAGADY